MSMSKIYLLLGVVVVLGLGGVYLMGGGNDALTAIAKLSPPSSLTAVAISPAQINLSWTDINTGEGGYEIYRSLNGSNGFKLIATAPQNSTSYSDQQGLSISTTYYYRSRAINGGSRSTYSSIASATTLATYVPTPTPTPTPATTPTPILTPTPTPISVPTPTPTYGEVEILRSGLLSGVSTYANLDALSDAIGRLPYNPAWIQSATPGTHKAYVTDVAGYTEKAGVCQFISLLSDCTYSTTTSVSCVSGSCSNNINVRAGYTTKIEFVYTKMPTPTPVPLRVSMYAWPNPVAVGQSAYWQASTTGGFGSLNYAWSGTDGLTGTSSYVSKIYTTSGYKLGMVTVTSVNESVSASSSLNVVYPTPSAVVGNISVVKAPDDIESRAGTIPANGERVLAKLRFTASGEDMTINKMHVFVSGNSSGTFYNDPSVVDEVPVLKLYDGATQIGAISGYYVNAAGGSTSIAEISGLGLVIPKDSSRVLIIKGVIPAIGQSGAGADFGTSVWVKVMKEGFEAQGATQKVTVISPIVGNEKIIYKSVPSFTSVSAGTSKLTSGTIPVFKFKIKADGSDQVSWKQIQFKVSVAQASVGAVEAVPGSSVGNLGLKDITGGGSIQLNIASAFSAYNSYSASQISFGSSGTQTGYISLLLNSEQVVPAATEKEYELSLNMSGISSIVGASNVTISIYKQEIWKSIGTVGSVRASNGVKNDASPSFIWSDNSASGHNDIDSINVSSTPDWANGYLLMGLPSNTITLSN